MAVLRNDVSWSRTRITAFETCRRRYFYQYYLKWNGWDRGAPEERRKAYRLANMLNLPMLAGLAVHEQIRNVLLAVRAGEPITVADAESAVAAHMKRTWIEARDRAWERNPKKAPAVFELYYNTGTTQDDIRRWGEFARRAIRTYLASDLHAALAASDHDAWLSVDEPPSFDDPTKALYVDGLRVWSRPDFARREGDRCLIYDWKTGSPKPQDATQILSYALHARDVWKFPAERITGIAVYIADELREEVIEVTPAALADVETRIRRDLVAMTALHTPDLSEMAVIPESDLRMAAFPTTTNLQSCTDCSFREICPVTRA